MSDDDEGGCECKPGLPGWLATFADLMSLLMCFFVLLLSFAEMDAMKFKKLAGSMAQAFGVQNKLEVVDVPKGTSIIATEFSPGEPEPTPINEIWQSTHDITEMSLEVQTTEEYDIEQGEEGANAGAKVRVKEHLEELIKETEQQAYELAEALKEQINRGEVEIETSGRKIIIRIREKGSFPSGSAELAPGYQHVMEEVRAVLATKPGTILVQGHTDDLPINTSRFRSNWELSSARAVSVVHELLKGGQLDAKRFEVSGKAETAPLVNSKSAEARARNRRVEIIIMQALENELTDEDKALLQTEEGEDILRELDLEPKYIFELMPEEIF
jgi:chemotaxis protein MotB